MKKNNDNFDFFIPVEILEKAGKNGEKEMIVQGVASTNEQDRQGETLEPNGYDCSYFLEQGVINWHHQSSKDPSSIIGYPMECRAIDNGSKFFIKGKFFSKSEMAKKVYQLIKDVKGTPRQVGWSIEGKATERHPLNKNRVLKARITGCALTYAPIGKNTYADVVKSFSGEGDINQPDKLKYEGKSAANGGEEVVLSMDLDDGKKLTVNKAGKVNIEKMLTTTSGAALKREDVEGAPKIITKSEDIYALIFEKFPSATIDRAKEIYKSINDKINK